MAEALAPTEIANRLSLAIGRLNRRMRGAAGELGHAHISTLATVVRDGPLRLADLAQIEVMSPPSMTRTIGELEARQLVTRTSDPADGRSFLISATEAGNDLVVKARSERAQAVTRLLEKLSDDDVARLTAALEVLEGMSVGERLK